MESMGCLRWLLMLVPMSLLTALGLGGMLDETPQPEPVPPTPYSQHDMEYFYTINDGTLVFPFLPQWTLGEPAAGMVSMTNSPDYTRAVDNQELWTGEYVVTVFSPEALTRFGVPPGAGPAEVIAFFQQMQAPDATYYDPIYHVINGRDTVRLDIVNPSVPIRIQLYAIAVEPGQVALTSRQTLPDEGYLGEEAVMDILREIRYLGDGRPNNPPPTLPPDLFTPTPTAYPATVIPTAMGAFSIELEDVVGAGDSEAEAVILGFNSNALMENWSLRFANGTLYYVFPQMLVMEGSQITVHTGFGANTPTDLYAGWNMAQWQSGDMIFLYDSAGRLMDNIVVP